MADIGTFTKTEDGFSGSIRTLMARSKARFVKVATKTERGPDYRIFAGPTELGACWIKVGQDSGNEYGSCVLDDPSFPAAINANLVLTEDGKTYQLLWSR